MTAPVIQVNYWEGETLPTGTKTLACDSCGYEVQNVPVAACMAWCSVCAPSLAPFELDLVPGGQGEPPPEAAVVAPLEPTHSDLAKLAKEPSMRDCAKLATCPALLGTRTAMLQVAHPSATHPYEWPK